MLISNVYASSGVPAIGGHLLSNCEDGLMLRFRNAHPRDSHITFFKNDHKYVLDIGTADEYTFEYSVSAICDMYFESFDPRAVCARYYNDWQGNCASRYFSVIQIGRASGQSDEEIQAGICDAWRANADKAALEGTIMHRTIELALNGCVYDACSTEIKYFHDFVKDYLEPRGWKVYRTEWAIYDLAAGVAGQVDCLFYNVSANTFHLMDWKRSKRFIHPETGSQFRKRGCPPCENMYANSWSKYALQQNLYAEILRRHYDIVVSTLSLGQFHCDLSNYRVIELPIMLPLASEILDSYRLLPHLPTNLTRQLSHRRSRSPRR